MSSDARSFALSTGPAVIVSTLAAIGAVVWLAGRGVSITDAAVVSLCGGCALGGMLVLGVPQRLSQLQKRLSARPVLVVALIAALCGLYLIFSIGTHTANARALIVMATYLSVPFFLLLRARGVAHGTWFDALTILWIWLPIELGIVRQFLITSNPATNSHYVFAQGLALNMGVLAFAAWRRLPEIGYRFELNPSQLRTAVFSFLCFVLIAIPLGFAIQFIRYAFEWSKLGYAPAAFVGIFLFTAIPEELLFRGLIQNWLEGMTASRNIGLGLASIVFGASHLNNGPVIPNYKYFLMASIAGVFYGVVWQRTRNLTAPAVTHALVDTAWTVFFR